jgi:hypothetical protein
MLCALLGACLGGSDESGDSSAGAPPPVPGPGANTPPTISGTPPASLAQGSPYTFRPTASDAETSSLDFSVSNKPAWATFNNATGELTGTPGAADVGSYSDIVISVSDGTLTASLPAFRIDVVQAAMGAAQLSWTPPTTHTDGSVMSDIAGYRIYYGRTQGNFEAAAAITNPGVADHVIDNLPAGTWYFAVTAIDSRGQESDLSNLASKVVL